MIQTLQENSSIRKHHESLFISALASITIAADSSEPGLTHQVRVSRFTIFHFPLCGRWSVTQ